MLSANHRCQITIWTLAKRAIKKLVDPPSEKYTFSMMRAYFMPATAAAAATAGREGGRVMPTRGVFRVSVSV